MTDGQEFEKWWKKNAYTSQKSMAKAEFLTAIALGRKAGMEECKKMINGKAEAIRDANTYRGKVNMGAEQSIWWLNDVSEKISQRIEAMS
jgi:hypothetical protein